MVLTQAPLHDVSPVSQAQLPNAQMDPVPQECPQAPQFFASEPVLTHVPLHAVPVVQPHALLTQLCCPVQAVPHEPQLTEAVVVSTHAPAQLVRPAGQDVSQAPWAHTCAEVHATPQAPQFSGSLDTATHLPLQEAAPGAQPHVPALHTPP